MSDDAKLDIKSLRSRFEGMSSTSSDRSSAPKPVLAPKPKPTIAKKPTVTTSTQTATTSSDPATVPAYKFKRDVKAPERSQSIGSDDDPFGSPIEPASPRLDDDEVPQPTAAQQRPPPAEVRRQDGFKVPLPPPTKPPLIRKISAASLTSQSSDRDDALHSGNGNGRITPVLSRSPVNTPARPNARIAAPPPPSPRIRSPRPPERRSLEMQRPRQEQLHLSLPTLAPIPHRNISNVFDEHDRAQRGDPTGRNSESDDSPLSSPEDVFKSPVETPAERAEAILPPPAIPGNKPSTSRPGSSHDDFKPSLPKRTATVQESTPIDVHRPSLPDRSRQMPAPTLSLPAAKPPSLPNRYVLAERGRPSAAATAVHLSRESSMQPVSTSRVSSETMRSVVSRPATEPTTLDSEDEDGAVSKENVRNMEQPDPSFASRKPPRFRGKDWEFQTQREVRKAAISGDLIMVAQPEKLKLFRISKGDVSWQIPIGDTKVTAMDFRTVELTQLEDAGRFLWVAFKDGSIHEYDLRDRAVVERNFRAHNSPITHLLRCWPAMWTIDECGTLNVWNSDLPQSLRGRPQPEPYKIAYGATAAVVAKDELWLASGRSVHAYRPSQGADYRLTPDRGLDPLRTTGIITTACYVPHAPDLVLFGHDDGKVSIFSRSAMECVEVLSLSHYSIVSMLNCGDYLWTSFKTGKVFVYDVTERPWRVMKEWTAHKSPISDLVIDRQGLWKEKRLSVCSASTDGTVKIWDGLLMEDWLDAEIHRRISEFSTSRPLRAVICTWNAGASLPNKLSRDYEDSRWIENMLRDAQEPDIISFGFQELVDLDDKGKASRSVAKGFFGKKKEKEPDEKLQAAAYREWQAYLERQVAIVSTRDDAYVLASCRNLVGLFTCIFVKRSVRSRIRHLAPTSVKTGLKGRYGNKGGIVVRMVIDDTSVALVNCHLAAGQKNVVARNNDVFSVLDQADLPPVVDSRTGGLDEALFVCGGDGSAVLDHEVCILNGDLNYRIAAPRSNVLQWIREKKLGKLLEADQLLIELRRNASHRLRSFQEAPIKFMPTYKYDPGTDNYDSSEKQRVPAWCDRVYFRGPAQTSSAVASPVSTMVSAGEHSHPAAAGATDRKASTASVHCESYVQHTCRVSDHRPVSATLVFGVKTVDSDRRAEVYEQVSRRWVDAAQRTILHRKMYILREALGRLDGRSTANHPQDAVDRRIKEALKKFDYDVPDAAAWLATQAHSRS